MHLVIVGKWGGRKSERESKPGYARLREREKKKSHGGKYRRNSLFDLSRTVLPFIFIDRIDQILGAFSQFRALDWFVINVRDVLILS